MTQFDASGYKLTGDAETRKRWSRSFFVILGLHAGVALLVLYSSVESLLPEAPPPAVLIDMTPTPPAPSIPKVEEPEVKPEELPVVEKAEVVLKKVKKEPEKPKPKPKKAEPVEVPRAKVEPAAPQRAQSPVEARPAVAPNYFATLFQHLAKYKKLPRRVGSQRADYELVVRFKLQRDGQLLSADVIRSSGRDNFDKAAIDTFKRANPFPPFPDTMPQASQTIDMPVVYEIGK
tara:strand:- start:1356 stop:2054 length:699 start_codon:yes stop_codon:yes gene_type:complete